MREEAVTDECAQYEGQPKRTQSKPVGREREQITYVGSALKIERDQGQEEVVRDQGQENIAARS